MGGGLTGKGGEGVYLGGGSIWELQISGATNIWSYKYLELHIFAARNIWDCNYLELETFGARNIWG